MWKIHSTASHQLDDLHKTLAKEEENFKRLKNATYSFQLWQRIPQCNLKFQELKPNYYDDTMKLIEDYYLTEEPLLQHLNVKEDLNSIWSIKMRIVNKLKDSTSIIALNEGNFLEVVGVLILVEINRNYFNSHISSEDLVHGACHKKYVQLTSSLVKNVDLYAMYDSFTVLRIYALCIKPPYRHIGLGLKFFETAVYIAQSLKIPVLMGIFTDSCMQVLGEKIGMKEIKSVKYTDWRSSDDDPLFADLKPENKICSLMAGKVHFPPPPIPTVAESTVHFSKKKKKKDKKDKKKGKKDKKNDKKDKKKDKDKNKNKKKK